MLWQLSTPFMSILHSTKRQNEPGYLHVTEYYCDLLVPLFIQGVRQAGTSNPDRRLYPFLIPTELLKLLPNIHLTIPLKYVVESDVKCVCSRYFESPF